MTERGPRPWGGDWEDRLGIPENCVKGSAFDKHELTATLKSKHTDHQFSRG